VHVSGIVNHAKVAAVSDGEDIKHQEVSSIRHCSFAQRFIGSMFVVGTSLAKVWRPMASKISRQLHAAPFTSLTAQNRMLIGPHNARLLTATRVHTWGKPQ
jgi:hypothetical protein